VKSVKDPCFAQAVRLRGLLLPGAGAFLDATPSGTTYMSRGSMTMALGMRIGAHVGIGSAEADVAECPLCVAGNRLNKKRDRSQSSTRQKVILDAQGTHALCSCIYGGDKTRRHNAVCDTIEQFGRMAKRSVRREVKAGTGNGKSRPGDVVFLNCGSNGTHVYTDVTLTYTGQPSKSYNMTAGEDTEGDAKRVSDQKDIKHRQVERGE